MSPFSETAKTLHGLGFSVIPIRPFSKAAFINSWSRYCSVQPTEQEISDWATIPDANIGICLGTASGLMALDFDDDIDGLHEKIMTKLPFTPLQKRGKKGVTLFYKYSGEPSKSYSHKGVRVLDLLSTGRQSVIPPSMHPDTEAPYEWVGDGPTPAVAQSIPALGHEALQYIESHFKNQKKSAAVVAKPFNFEKDGGSDISEALKYISAHDYDDWVKIGMTIKDKLGDAGFDLWDSWSATSPKYDGSTSSRKKWHSFNGQGLTIATMFDMAIRNGYIPVRSEPDLSRIFAPGGNLEAESKRSAIIAYAEPDNKKSKKDFNYKLLAAPNLIRDISAYINSQAIYPQPVLSLAAAISAVGTVMGHRFQTETGLRSNMYCLGLAPSGAGKGHALGVISNLFHAAGVTELLIGDFASGAGVVSSLVESEGVALCLWDEAGRGLASINNPRASSHQRDIMTYIMRMFSDSDKIFRGQQYANHDGKMARKDIDQPCLSIYGTTVPGRFYQAMEAEDAVDGFLSRWLIFESNDYSTEPADVVKEPLPVSIIDTIREIQSLPKCSEPTGNLSDVVKIDPKVIPMTDNAKRYFREYQRDMRVTISKDLSSLYNPIYGRCAEHAAKIALVAHDYKSGVIDEEVMLWAIELATHCAEYMIKGVAENVSKNETEAESKKLYKVIKDDNPITHTSLVRKTQWLKTGRRNEILGQLIEIGLVTPEERETGKRKTNIYSVATAA